MRELKPYSEYKDSGVSWLGQIPDSWETTPVARLSESGNKKFVDGDWIEAPFIEDSGVRLIQTGNIGIGEYREKGFRYISDKTFSLLNCTEISPGDILICRLGDPVGRSCIAPDLGVRMITSVDVCILKLSDNHDSRFINYAHSSEGFLSWISSLVRGSTRDRVSRSMLGKFRLPTPPLSEQRAISSFLDRETAEIDAFIADQDELIALLNERRAATITQSITKGLDPNASMKDSNVEWLGKVPEAWKVTRLTRYFDVILGKMLDAGKEAHPDASLLPYIRAANIQDTGLKLSDVKSMPFTAVEAANLSIRSGDLLVVEGGSIGTSYLVRETMEGWSFQKTVNRVRSKGDDLTSFLQYVIRSYRDSKILDTLCNGSTIAHLTAEKLLNLTIPMPSLEVQREIVDYLDYETAEIDAAISDAKEAVELSKERRAALISVAVTGKVDVRNRITAELGAE